MKIKKLILSIFVACAVFGSAVTTATYAAREVPDESDKNSFIDNSPCFEETWDEIRAITSAIDTGYKEILARENKDYSYIGLNTYDSRAKEILKNITNEKTKISVGNFIYDTEYEDTLDKIQYAIESICDCVQMAGYLNKSACNGLGYSGLFSAASEIHEKGFSAYNLLELSGYRDELVKFYSNGATSITGLLGIIEKQEQALDACRDALNNKLTNAESRAELGSSDEWNSLVNEKLYTFEDANTLRVENNTGSDVGRFVFDSAITFGTPFGSTKLMISAINLILALIGWILDGMVQFLGISIDNIIFGRLFEKGVILKGLNNKSAYTTLFSFGLENGNIYGLIATKVYRTISGYSYLIITTVSLFMFIKASVTQQGAVHHMAKTAGAKAISSIKDLAKCILCAATAPVAVEIVLQARDLAVYYLVGDSMRTLFGTHKIGSLLGQFQLTADKGETFVSWLNAYANLTGTLRLILWIAASGACFSFLFQYVGYALAATIHLMVFPLVCVQRTWNGMAIKGWIKSFASIMMLPLIDALMLLIPASLVRVAATMPNRAASIYYIIAMICMYCIKPCRQTAFRLLGLSEQQLGQAAEGAGKAMAGTVANIAKVAAAVATAGAAAPALAGAGMGAVAKGAAAIGKAGVAGVTTAGTTGSISGVAGSLTSGLSNTSPAITKPKGTEALGLISNSAKRRKLVTGLLDKPLSNSPFGNTYTAMKGKITDGVSAAKDMFGIGRDLEQDIKDITRSEYGRNKFAEFENRAEARDRVAKQAGVMMGAVGGIVGGAIGMAGGEDMSMQLSKSFSHIGYASHEAAGKGLHHAAFTRMRHLVEKEEKSRNETDKIPQAKIKAANNGDENDRRALLTRYNDLVDFDKKEGKNGKAVTDISRLCLPEHTTGLNERVTDGKHPKKLVLPAFAKKASTAINRFARTGDERFLKTAKSYAADSYCKDMIKRDPDFTPCRAVVGPDGQTLSADAIDNMRSESRIPAMFETRESAEACYKKVMEKRYKDCTDALKEVTDSTERRKIMKKYLKEGDIIHDCEMTQLDNIRQYFSDKIAFDSGLDDRIYLSPNDTENIAMFRRHGEACAGTWASDRKALAMFRQALTGKDIIDGTKDREGELVKTQFDNLLSMDYIQKGLSDYIFRHSDDGLTDLQKGI